MTIKYLDSKRISGLSTDVADTATMSDDFTSYASQSAADAVWVPSEATAGLFEVDIVNDNIEINFTTAEASAEEELYRDLTSVSDSSWVMRFKLDTTAITNVSSGAFTHMYGISSVSGDYNVTQDSIIFGFQVTTGSTVALFAAYSNNGNQDNNLVQSDFTHGGAVEILYIEIVRLSTTSYRITLYSDSEYTQVIESKTLAVVSTVANLRYMKFNYRDGTGGSGALSQTIDDVSFYNGVSSLSSKPTNVQDNSILVEKDTGKRYWFDADSSNYTQYGWAVDSTVRIQTAGAAASLPSTGTFTWSFWYRPNSISAEHYLFNKMGSQTNEYSPRLYLQTTGALKATSTTNNVGYGGQAITSNTMTTGSWNHVIVKQTGSTIYAILNDGAVASASVISGNNSGEDYQFFLDATGVDGDIKNAILYSTALSASDITALYNSGVPATSSTAGVTSNILIEHIFDSSVSITSAANTGSLGGSASVISGTASVVGTPATWTKQTDMNLAGLKAYWKFNEASGDIVNQSTSVGSTDSLGTAADLQTSGMTYVPSSGSSPFGYEGSFDGTNDYAGAGTSLSQFNFLHSTTAAWTIAFWVKWTGSGSQEIFNTMDSVHAANENGFNMYFVNTNAMTVAFGNGSSATFSTTSSNTIPNKTAFHFVVVRYDQSLGSSALKICVNDGTVQNFAASAYSNNNNAARIGKIGEMNDRGDLAGLISEFSIWNRVLTDTEVTTLYNSGVGKAIS